MSRRLKQTAAAFAMLFAAAQLLRPERANPVVDDSRTIQRYAGTATGIVPILDRSCRDCHSDRTVWPWYTQVAPLSWLMTYGVTKGRKAVNFSEWGAYPQVRQQELLAEACQDVSDGKMPGAYAVLHPETRLSTQDVETICAAARVAAAEPAGRSQEDQ